MIDKKASLFNFDEMYRGSHPTCKDGHYEICDDWNYEFQTRSLAPEETINSEDRIVLCIGDSFTFGDGVYYRDTWTHKLQETVFKDYKVINAGIRGASNDAITNILAKWCSKYGDQIEFVIAVFSFNNRRTYYRDKMHSLIGVFEPANRPDWYKGIHSSFVNLSNDINDEENFEKNVLLTKGLGKIYNFKTYWGSIEEHAWTLPPNPERLCANPEIIDSDNFHYVHMIWFDVDSNEKRNKFYISEHDRHWSSEGHIAVAKRFMKHI
jgi:hypothetical protein